MRLSPPVFWQQGELGLLARLLRPLSHATALATARRVAGSGWRAPVPVICCGNAGLGGAGKTTLVLDLAQRLLARDVAVHLLTRGHGGIARGPLRVDAAAHTARTVGDEALLLAQCAPTWLCADRAAAARLALADGAGALLMDDGLQNSTLAKTASLLVIDGAAGFGNGCVMPAGPLREPVHAAAARCRAAVLIGADRAGARAYLPPGLPVLEARLVPGQELDGLRGHPVVAFAGIGRPEKFFAMLEQGGVVVARRMPFPDHHRFTPADLACIRREARALGAPAVTTRKDLIRLAEQDRAGFSAVGVSLAWGDSRTLDALLDGVLGG